MISQRFNNGFPFQGDGLLQADICRRGTDLDDKQSGSDVPLTFVLMTVEAELLRIELSLHRLGLSWLE